MVETVEGIKIDADTFPITYKARRGIVRIARQYKYPAQDALQECMMFEITKQDYLSKRTDPKGTMEQNMRFKAMQYFRRHILCRMDNRDYKDEVIKLAERGLIPPIKGATSRMKKGNITSWYVKELITRGLIQAREGSIVSTETFTDIPDGVYTSDMIVFTRRDMHNKLFMNEVREILADMQQIHRDLVQRKLENPALSWRAIHKEFFCRQVAKSQFFNKVHEVREVCRRVREQNKRRYGLMAKGSFHIGVDGFFNDIKVQLQHNVDRDVSLAEVAG
jgi:hypothetical protein